MQNPPSMFEQQPPLQGVLAPPQSPSHWWSAVEHALSRGQSAATLQPHVPPTQAVLLGCAEQLTHPPPLVPHAPAAVPPTHVPFAQQPPWHAWPELHVVVQVVPLQAWPKGQSVVLEQRLVQMPPEQICVSPQTCPPPHPPQLFESEV